MVPAPFLCPCPRPRAAPRLTKAIRGEARPICIALNDRRRLHRGGGGGCGGAEPGSRVGRRGPGYGPGWGPGPRGALAALPRPPPSAPRPAAPRPRWRQYLGSCPYMAMSAAPRGRRAPYKEAVPEPAVRWCALIGPPVSQQPGSREWNGPAPPPRPRGRELPPTSHPGAPRRDPRLAAPCPLSSPRPPPRGRPAAPVRRRRAALPRRRGERRGRGRRRRLPWAPTAPRAGGDRRGLREPPGPCPVPLPRPGPAPSGRALRVWAAGKGPPTGRVRRGTGEPRAPLRRAVTGRLPSVPGRATLRAGGGTRPLHRAPASKCTASLSPRRPVPRGDRLPQAPFRNVPSKRGHARKAPRTPAGSGTPAAREAGRWRPRFHACPLRPRGQAAGGGRRDGRGAAAGRGAAGPSFRCGFATEPWPSRVLAAPLPPLLLFYFI